MTRTLLLGMGNPVLRDDAVGVRLAAQIGARLGSRPELDVIEECSVGGLNLLDVVEGYDRLIVLDSIKAGGPPGHWYPFDERMSEPLERAFAEVSAEIGEEIDSLLSAPAKG